MSEYICITRAIIDLIKDANMTKRVSDDKIIACHLMAIIETAIEGSKLSNQKIFYESIEKIAKNEKGKAHES